MRTGRLVSWTLAWQVGLVSYDDVLDSTQGTDRPHRVTGTVGDLALGRFLVEVRRVPPRLVLPVPGDPRGLPGPGPFTDHALQAGEALLSGTWGLVPEEQVPAEQPADLSGAVRRVAVVWHSYAVPVVAAEHPSLADAEHELSTAVRATATALSRLDVARLPPGLAPAIAALRRPAGEVALPPGYPARAHRLLALADRVATILRLAATDPSGAAPNASAATMREDLLRSVGTAVRHARLAAYNAGVVSI